MKPPLTIEESLAYSKELQEKTLNKNLYPCFRVKETDFLIRTAPPGYRLLNVNADELDNSWHSCGLIWSDTLEDTTGVWTNWETNLDHLGTGIYAEPGHIYAVPV